MWSVPHTHQCQRTLHRCAITGGLNLLRANLIRSDDPRWPRLLAAVPHDFYHSPAYVELSAREERGVAGALHVTDGDRQMLLPLIMREIPGGGLDATSPYGSPGPLVAPVHDEQFLAQALSAGIESMASEGYVSLFVRMHPLLFPDVPIGIGTVVHHSPTVAIDLSQTDEVWKTSMRKSHRQQIARALASGHRAYVDEDWRHFEVFKRNYRHTMRRLGAGQYYDFSDTYFDDLRQALGGSLSLCVIEREGHVWAAGLFVETHGIVQSHLSGDDGTYRHGGAKKLMYAYVRDWAKERGNRWLHLGGGGPSGGGLLSFKTGFSRDVRPFNTLRIILREDEYERLTASRDPEADPRDASGYFPGYRQEK